MYRHQWPRKCCHGWEAQVSLDKLDIIREAGLNSQVYRPQWNCGPLFSGNDKAHFFNIKRGRGRTKRFSLCLYAWNGWHRCWQSRREISCGLWTLGWMEDIGDHSRRCVYSTNGRMKTSIPRWAWEVGTQKWPELSLKKNRWILQKLRLLTSRELSSIIWINMWSHLWDPDGWKGFMNWCRPWSIQSSKGGVLWRWFVQGWCSSWADSIDRNIGHFSGLSKRDLFTWQCLIFCPGLS